MRSALSATCPTSDLAYFEEGTQHFDDYVEAVGWAQEFARANREVMMDARDRGRAQTVSCRRSEPTSRR